MLSNVSAFLLHSKPFRESSQWVSLFTYEFGRLAAIYRPSTRQGGQRALAPFQALVVEIAGAGELKTLRRAEDPCPALLLSGVACYAGWYVNELIYRLLPLQEPHPRVFDDYAALLVDLTTMIDIAARLRSFESILLNELGHGLDLRPQDHPAQSLDEARAWYFNVAEGRVEGGDASGGAASGGGQWVGPLDPTLLQAAARGEWTVSGAASLARRLHGARIDHILEGRPLHSRELLKNYLEVGLEKKGTSGR